MLDEEDDITTISPVFADILQKVQKQDQVIANLTNKLGLQEEELKELRKLQGT